MCTSLMTLICEINLFLGIPLHAPAILIHVHDLLRVKIIFVLVVRAIVATLGGWEV